MAKDTILVKCPKCGDVKRSKARTSTKCLDCGYNFKIFPKTKMSRVVKEKVIKKPKEFQSAKEIEEENSN